MPYSWDEATHRLSDRARAFLHAVTAWVNQLPAGTVDVTYDLFPPDDDYGSELLVTFRPQKPHGCALIIGVISDTLFPFHFHLGELNGIAAAARLTLSPAVPTHVPFFLDHRGAISPEDLLAICRAVAAARITFELGTIRNIVWAVEGWLSVPSGLRSLHLHGSNGPMRLVKLIRWCGYGEILTLKFVPWV